MMIEMRKALMLALLLLLAAAPACVLAQSAGGQPPASATPAAPAAPAPATPAQAASPVAWSSLSPEQQRLLGPVAAQWNSLPPARQQALARGSTRWLDMSPEQRSMARQRFQQWRRLTPGERQTIRRRWQQFRSLPPQQQQAIRRSFRAHGFDDIETPVMEDSDRLHAGLGGDNEKLAFGVLKRGLTHDDLQAAREPLDLVDLGLRFDLTVPLARFYATHRAELPTIGGSRPRTLLTPPEICRLSVTFQVAPRSR